MNNEGKRVAVHYVGTLDDGTKFDSSRDRNEPLRFTCMAGQMIAGFDAAVRDMEVGQTVNVRLEPAEAYGERRDDMAPWDSRCPPRSMRWMTPPSPSTSTTRWPARHSTLRLSCLRSPMARKKSTTAAMDADMVTDAGMATANAATARAASIMRMASAATARGTAMGSAATARATAAAAMMMTAAKSSA